MKQRISGRYEYAPTPGIGFDPKDPASKSKTQQHFKDEVDINNIVERFVRTGSLLMDDVNRRAAAFGDVSEVGDYKTVVDKIQRLTEEFEKLPASVRARFQNDPSLLLEFLSDEGNREEAVKLGLVAPKAPEAPPTAPEAPTGPIGEPGAASAQ